MSALLSHLPETFEPLALVAGCVAGVVVALLLQHAAVVLTILVGGVLMAVVATVAPPDWAAWIDRTAPLTDLSSGTGFGTGVVLGKSAVHVLHAFGAFRSNHR
ncbi:MAG: hypothetical protein ACU0CI_06345 [Shimia sp.]